MQRIPVHFRRLAVVIVLALLVTPVLAQRPGGHGPRHGQFQGLDGAMHERLFEQLDLTDDQREQIDELIADHHSLMQDRREQVRSRRTEVRDLTHADELDEASIRDAVMAAAAAEADMAVERARLRQRIHQVLTPEQQDKAERMIERRRERMKEGGSGRRGGRGPHGGWHGHGPKQDLDDD
jgi:protein CpxP